VEEAAGEQDGGLGYNELMNIVEGIVLRMPEKRSMVFQLCFMKQFTYREAAGTLDVSLKTVENHMALAFKELREKLAAIYGDEIRFFQE
jgi:RNA polymerase sigma-70 factor, ECF subfamily